MWGRNNENGMEKKEKREIRDLSISGGGNNDYYFALDNDDGLDYFIQVGKQLQWDEEHNMLRMIDSLLDSIRFYNIEWSENMYDYLHDNDIQSTLEAFGLDYRKFWFLCLGVKWLTLNYKKSKPVPLRKEILQSMVDTMEKMSLEDKTGKKASLKLSAGGKDTLIVTDKEILLNVFENLKLISRAVKYDTDYPWGFPTDSDKEEYCESQCIAYFKAILDCFTKNLKANRKIAASYDKEMLISRMVYRIGLSNNPKYLEEWKQDKLEQNIKERYRFLKGQIADYKDKVDPKEYHF